MAAVASFVCHPDVRASLPAAGPKEAWELLQSFAAPVAEDPDMWDFEPLASKSVVAPTDVGAYALLAALFQLSFGGAPRGQRCARLAGDVRPPEGHLLCASWRTRRDGSAPMLDDAWLEGATGAEHSGAPRLQVEALKRRRSGGGWDALLFTTSQSEQTDGLAATRASTRTQREQFRKLEL